MADYLTFFPNSFLAGSPLHRFHPGCWLGCFFILSLTIISSQYIALSVISLLVLVLVKLNRLSLLALAKPLKGFLLFAIFIWGIFVLGQPTMPGLVNGTKIAWRLLLLLSLGALLTITASLFELQTLLEGMIKFFPFLPARRISMLFTLTLRFLVLIGHKSQTVREAQWARAIQMRKNPYYRITCFAVVLLRNLFLQADTLSAALEARCYSDDKAGKNTQSTGVPSATPITISSPDSQATIAQFKLKDFLSLGLVSLICGCLLLFKL